MRPNCCGCGRPPEFGIVRFAIYGVGGVGGLFGALLIRSGVETGFIARGKHLAAIRKNGLTVSSPSGEMQVSPFLATDEPGRLGGADVVLLCVKAEQVTDAASRIKPLLLPETVVIPLQNGVEAAEQVRSVIPSERVLAGLCGMMSWVAAPGHVRTLGNVGFIKFGEADNRLSERVLRLREVFTAAGIDAEIPADIDVAQWEKFLFIASLGGVAAVNNEAFGVIRDNPDSRRMLELAMTEIRDLGVARGVRLDDAVVQRTMGFVDELPETATASLQRDIADGKPSELEAWSGAVVRLGRAAGMSTPVHDFIYETLLPKETAARQAQIGSS